MNIRLKQVGLLLALFIVGSCSNDMIETSNNSSLIEESYDEIDLNSLKSEFSFALARVLNESEGVRKLIKEEAIKQFDYDYDVLYMLVKDKQLSGGGTLEGFLLKYISRENLLTLYKEMPTLTIFVPSLPGDSFSAERWNTAQEIPYVAYKNKENEILFVDNTGNLDIINHDEIPIFPIVVVKPSERVILQSASTRSSNNPCIMRADNGINFVFEYDEFNNITPSKANTRAVEIPDNLKRIYDAKKYADQNGVWQRDYIYYGISTMEGMGMYRNNISECIYAFELTGDPNDVYGKISDQDDDPHFDPNARRGMAGWYGGNYEFMVKTYISSSQLVSNEIIKVLSISPKYLFWYNGEKRRDETQIKTVGAMAAFKKYYLPKPIPLFDWNLENYSSSIIISIEEKDIETTEQNVTKTTSTFATNFEFNPTFAAVVKIGAKMGASATVSHEVSTTITRYLNSDVLGDVIINFGDDVVIKNEMENIGKSGDEGPTRKLDVPGRTSHTPKPIYVPVLNPKYNSGRYKIEIIPLAQY